MGDIQHQRRLGLIGFGAFGRLAAGGLAEHFEVVVHDPAYARAELADGRHLPMGSLEEVARAEIVVIAVPVARMAHLCGQLAPLLQPGAVVVDVGSVKVGPVATMREALPAHVEIVGTHPLFGPQSFGRAPGAEGCDLSGAGAGASQGRGLPARLRASGASDDGRGA